MKENNKQKYWAMASTGNEKQNNAKKAHDLASQTDEESSENEPKGKQTHQREESKTELIWLLKFP